jgi:hypothetical protein
MNETSYESQTGANWKAVYTIIDRGPDHKKIWIRIGTAWVTKDQSLNIRLDASPTNGVLHIRESEFRPVARRALTAPLAQAFGEVAASASAEAVS